MKDFELEVNIAEEADKEGMRRVEITGEDEVINKLNQALLIAGFENLIEEDPEFAGKIKIIPAKERIEDYPKDIATHDLSAEEEQLLLNLGFTKIIKDALGRENADPKE
jgi:hypothetical protein